MLKICHKPILDESSTYSASGEISESVGHAKLSGSNPIGLKPRAVASTSAKSHQINQDYMNLQVL